MEPIVATRDYLWALKAAFDNEEKRKRDEEERIAKEKMNKAIRVVVEKIKKQAVDAATQGRTEITASMWNVQYKEEVVNTLREEMTDVVVTPRAEMEYFDGYAEHVIKDVYISWA